VRLASPFLIDNTPISKKKQDKTLKKNIHTTRRNTVHKYKLVSCHSLYLQQKWENFVDSFALIMGVSTEEHTDTNVPLEVHQINVRFVRQTRQMTPKDSCAAQADIFLLHLWENPE
jgi:hypothetical protein